MPTTEIVFFNGWESSKKGLGRGLISFIPIFIFSSLYYKYKGNTSFTSVFFISLAMCSAIGVQLPSSLRESYLYGGSVGLLVSLVIVSHLYTIPDGQERSKVKNVFFIICITILCSIISTLTWKLSNKFNLYPPSYIV